MTARVTVVGGVKGGAGKSTIATNLAIMLAEQGKDVLLVDADDQKSSVYFTSLRNEKQETKDRAQYTCIALTGVSVRTETKLLAQKFQEIVIDCGGRDTVSQRAALTIANKMVLPFVPGAFDIWTVDNCVDIIQDVQSVNPDLETYSFINRADARGQDNSEAAALISEHSILNFGDTPLGNRKAFRNATSEGVAVVELKSADTKSTAEIRALFAALFGDENNNERKG